MVNQILPGLRRITSPRDMQNVRSPSTPSAAGKVSPALALKQPFPVLLVRLLPGASAPNCSDSIQRPGRDIGMEAIADPLAGPSIKQHAGLSQYREMARYLGLGEIQCRREIAHAALDLVGQQNQNSKAHGMGSCTRQVFGSNNHEITVVPNSSKLRDSATGH